jgi:hypothetical protein
LNILSLLVLNYSLIIDSWSSSYSIKCPIYPSAILFKLEWCWLYTYECYPSKVL